MKTDNKIYLYDDSLINLLNVIFYLIDNKIKPLDIKSEEIYMPNLVDQTIKIKLDNDNKVIERVVKNISYQAFAIVYRLYNSVDKNKELIMYYFILNGLKYGNNIIYLRKLKCVNEALRINKYVGFETHKLKGFLRFKEINNQFLYAEINPTNNVIDMLSRHFSKRLSNESWIIKDINRNLISIYKNHHYYIIDADNISIENFTYSTNEKKYEELWTSFFKTIGIQERKNLRCQMNFMPKKYWQYIIEMRDNNE